MNVYILTFRNASTRFDSNAEVIGVFADENLAKARVDEARKKHVDRGGGFLAQDHEDGKGVTLYHEMGSMSFVPGVYSYKEYPVAGA